MPPKRTAQHYQPKQAAAGNYKGRDFILNPNFIYAADDELVREYPDLFKPIEPTRARPQVEQATAAPGEQR